MDAWVTGTTGIMFWPGPTTKPRVSISERAAACGAGHGPDRDNVLARAYNETMRGKIVDGKRVLTNSDSAGATKGALEVLPPQARQFAN